MSGRYAKRLRKHFGISIQARRSNAEFMRLVEKTREERAAAAMRGALVRRRVLSWVALGAMLGAIAGAFFL